MADEIDFSPLERALDSLAAALAPPPRNDRERDGAIQRFEFAFELTWKTLRRVLIARGRAEVPASPKPLWRLAVEERLIDDVSPWFEYTESRNASSHVYNESIATKVFADCGRFLEDARRLCAQLRS